MPYPELLLPKIEYREELIVDDLVGDSADYYLIRISTGAILDPTEIKIRELCQPTKEFVGLSTNLLGIFELGHLPFKALDRPKEDYWVRSDGTIDAGSIHYEEVGGREPIFIRISQLQDIGFSAAKQVGKEMITIDFKVRLLHKPTRPNYWHFEVRVFNSADQQELDRDHLPDWAKNAMKKFVEIDICHKASGIPPDLVRTIPHSLFVDNFGEMGTGSE